MTAKPRSTGHSKTDLRRGRVRSAKPHTQATTRTEQEFLFSETAHSPVELKKKIVPHQ